MIQSMTGFGRSSAGKGNEKITVSIKCVNGKVLDLKIRGLDLEYSVEKSIRDFLSEKIIRGTIYINFELDSNHNSKDFVLNDNRLELLIATVAAVEKKYGYKLDINKVITTNDLFLLNESSGINPKLILKAIKDASSKVIKMRKIEGVALRNDIQSRVVSLKKILSSIVEQLPLEYKKRIKKTKDRVSEILKDFQLDEARMNQEIAHIADKSDVTEEIIRLKSHFSQFEKFLKSRNPQEEV